MTRDEAVKIYVTQLLEAGWTRHPVTRGLRYVWLLPDGTRALQREVHYFLSTREPLVPDHYHHLAPADTWRLLAAEADSR